MLNRRDFLKRAASCSAFLAARPTLARAQSKSPGAKMGAVRFSVCVDMIMTEIPFLERMERVKRIGYTAFEFWDWKSKDVDAIIRKKDELGLEVATVMGSGWKQLNTEEARKAFVSEIQSSVAAAKRLGSKTLIVTTGLEDRRMARAEQHANYVAALKAAAPHAEAAQVTLVLEPLNTKVDHPAYYLQTAKEGFEMIDEVASPAVKMLFDIYHHQIMEGNVIEDITKNIPKIAHFHVADVPGRHEPGTGEINYANVFRAIAASGYQGYVGLEYKPSRPAEETLRSVLKMAE
ncbi:MAG TPA: TIM barrel protein [Blastocatellia bacterium]|nr:TIM barrel protein [Blastocatellia bacterium]